MSENNKVFENGQVKISDEVVATIVGIATMDVDGVCGMHTGLVEGFSNLFSKNNYSKGVKVEITENKVAIDIFINVKYGCKISEVATNVQTVVKKEVETMTDLEVSAVNVNVQNIITEKNAKQEEEKAQ